MSQLLRQLRESKAVDEQGLQSASRRQQIYGGSLDTVLLELDLIDAVDLDTQLAAANRCPSVPIAVLEPGPERPWDILPRELVDLGWTMPLRRHMGRIQVAIHPEIPDDRRALLERSVEHVEVFVTAEACLAKIAAERTGSVMPQRYAVLALTWIHRLRRTQASPPERDPDAPRIERPIAAPWMTAPTTAPYTMPPPQELAQRKPAEPKPGDAKPGDSKPSSRSPTFLYGLPVDDDASGSTSAVRAGKGSKPDAEPTPEPAPTPAVDVAPPPAAPEPAPAPAASAPAASPPTAPASSPPETTLPPEDDDGYVDPLAGVDDEDDAPVPPRPTPPARPSALQDRLAGPRSALEEATARDQATDALVRAAMVLSRRVGLFGVKREGLRGLASPGEISDLTDQLVEISPAIEKAIDGREALDMVTDLDLRMAVGQESPVPCLFLPISVQGRAVLMLYVDRSGEPFSVEEVDAAYELCDIAGRTLEGVLLRLRNEGSQAKPTTTPTPAPTPAPAPQPTAATPIKPPPSSSLFAPPNLPGLSPRPGSGPLFSPPSLPGRPASVPVPAATPLPAPPRPTAITPTPLVAPPVRIPPPATPASAAPPAPTASLPSLITAPPDPELAKPPIRLHRAPSSSHVVAELPAPPIEPPAAIEPPAPPIEPPAPPVEPPAPPVEPPAAIEPPAPPIEPPVRPGMTPLATPLGSGASEESGTIRGRIVLDDEDRPRAGSASSEIDSAIAAALRGGSADIVHLRSLGEPALQRIAKLFPGELDVHRRDLDTLPPLPAHGALIRVALEIGRDLGPHLIEVMDHPNPNTRFYTAFVFQELRDERAIPSLGELSFDPDADVRAIAMRVLETYSAEPGFDTAVALIRRELDSPNRTRQLHSTRAVGTLRDIQAVSKLIELLSSKERYIQEAALESLCSVTGQQLGLKPHRWKSWYADNAHHHRVEWIMSSLAHKDLSVRRWAADELRRITGQRIMFPAAGTKQEREIGLQKWVEWWRDEGRGKFG